MATTLRAHAKLTITLRVTGVRPDGYHLIDAEMVSLDLHDLITLTRRTGDAGTPPTDVGPDRIAGITASGPFAAGMPLDGTNLIARALALGATTAAVHVDKRIPHGGGLGGGSTDAAAVLAWSGFDTSADDLERASRLGADIPFCLVGGRARVRGIGEIVDPLPHVERTVTLVIPPFGVSTPAVYRQWDELGAPTGEGPNDLESAALAVEPELLRWRELIGERTGEPPVLAGSGATWFTDGERANALADLVGEGAAVIVARTVPTDVATNRSGFAS